MKKFKTSEIRKMVREIISEVFANKYGQGGNLPEAEKIAAAVWAGVYLVMPKGEKDNVVFYRVTLNNSTGPVKYLKQDAGGRWYYMNPPVNSWRPVDQSKVVNTDASQINECDCAPGCKCLEKDSMKGDTTDVQTMNAVNVNEGNLVASGGKFKVYITYVVRGDQKYRTFNSNSNSQEEAKKSVIDYMQSIAAANRIERNSIKVLSIKRNDLESNGENVNESEVEYMDLLQSSNEAIKSFNNWKKIAPENFKHNVANFVAGYNSALNDMKKLSVNEMTTSGAVFSGGPTIQTPYAFSKKGDGSKKAMDATKKAGYKKAKKPY